jgi:hypothetical protein
MADQEAVARIVVLGRSVRRVPVAPGMDLRAVLASADVDPGGRDLHVNGRAADLDTPVEAGDLVTVIPRVRGGMHLCTIEALKRTLPEAASA